MAPPRVCPGCGGENITTDYALGTVVCQDCGLELEQGILVSEVGFAEGAGGRMHVQGTFVSHHSTGINTFRGHGPTSENIKEEGRKRIQLICNQMGILPSVQRGAQRFYSLAVDNKFNRGRRTDYVVASCIYLYSRFEKDALMLIDFSERMQINVYELGATYLKLRAALNLDQVLPEIDPAVYNIRFANRLDLGNKAAVVARDASRLVKRFKADWMTAGRRPAGICGACLVIASRMSDFLRTPEEVAQIVKVSPQTIKKRLMEFAQTTMASKTVEEWRALTDDQLEAVDENEMPPVVKQAMAREAKLKRIRELSTFEEDGSRAGSPSEPPSKRQRKDGELDGDLAAADTALAAAAAEIGTPAATEDGDDEDMEALAKEDYVIDIQRAGDDSEEARIERKRERRKLFRGVKAAAVAEGDEEDDEELDELAADEKYDEDKEDKDDEDDEAALARSGGFKDLPPPPDWNDKAAVYEYIEKHFFGDEADLVYVSKTEKTARIDRWLRGREPKDVIGEMRSVQWAHHVREWEAKQSRNIPLDDLDDDELDMYFVMEEGEQQARARMWLSHNGRWLEEDREKQARKAALAAQKAAEGPGRAAPKRNKKAKRTQPFASAREAIDNFAASKKFSSRINMDAIRKLDAGLANREYDLQSMGDDDDKEDKEDKEDSKEDHMGGDDDDDFEFDIPEGQMIDHKYEEDEDEEDYDDE